MPSSPKCPWDGPGDRRVEAAAVVVDGEGKGAVIVFARHTDFSRPPVADCVGGELAYDAERRMNGCVVEVRAAYVEVHV